MRTASVRPSPAAFAVLAAALLALAPVASAQMGQQPMGPQAGKRPCLGDMKKLCADAGPGPEAKLACLEKHKAELSPACAQHLEQGRSHMRARADALHKACDADVKKLCAEVAPGHGALLRCLHQHSADLAPSCRDALPALPSGQTPAPGKS